MKNLFLAARGLLAAITTAQLACASLLLAGCNEKTPMVPDAASQAPDAGALDVPDGPDGPIFRLALVAGLTDYFVYRGRPRGFEYDLASRFAAATDLRLNVELVGGWAEAEQALRDGRVDAAAVGAALTVTPGGLIPGPVYAHSDSAIITHQSTAPTRIWVLPKSPASQDLGRWCLPPCKAILTPQFKHDWALLKALQARRPDGVTGVAVARRYGAAMAAMDRDLVIHDGLGPSRPVRWWLAGEQWRKPVTIFFSGPRAHSLLTALQARYFDAPYQMRLRARPFVRSDLSRRLTPWDKLLRRAATRFRIDWRLLAAVMMRESGHDPQATSSAGARGIFQLMPNTAKMLRVKDATEPREAIPAAARYLRQLQDRYIDVINPHERRLFALAAYNAGPGHVDDARSLAASIGLADDRWWEGVGLSLPLLAQPKYGRAAPHGTCQGMVATRYAESVLALFDQYVQVVPESLHETDAGAPAR